MGHLLTLNACSSGGDWRTADRSSAGLAPLASEESEAIVQVYHARAFSWRGNFGVHSWIATKDRNADNYTTYHLMGWRLRRAESAVEINPKGIPDARWYGAEPTLIRDIRGPLAEKIIPKIEAAANSYPHSGTYRVWPGPNSNTFISHILREVPEIGVELPPHAVGRDYLSGPSLTEVSESGTGFQLSLWGLAGLTLGLGDGIEMNLLGFSFGIDFYRPALKLPMLGRLGFDDAPAFASQDTGETSKD